ncbi:MAG TPA: hypothetical protein VEY67_07215 [Candidatus Dormibacteraeota bacterium]|nr:hypothetical protein [Candidatus Dormibacteraeota bacterium]
MRGCLTVLVGGLAFLAVLGWYALPVLAASLVTVTLATAGVSGTGTSVDVVASPPYELLAMHADEVDIVSSSVSWRGITAASMSVRLDGVDLGARTAASVTGRLASVSVPTGDGPLPVDSIALDGPSGSIRAVLALDAATVARLARAAAAQAIGREPTAVELGPPDHVIVTVGSQRSEGQLVVQPDGTIAISLPPFGSAVLADPAAGLPFRLEGVVVAPGGGVTLSGTIDPAALGLSR